MKRYVSLLISVIIFLFGLTPSLGLANNSNDTSGKEPFDSVPEEHEGYVPDGEPDEMIENDEKADDSGFTVKMMAKVIDGVTKLFDWLLGDIEFEKVIFGKVNPLSGSTFDSESIGNIFSSGEWNYAINPLRIAFASIAWVFFAFMIANYGIRYMKESTNPIQRTQLLEDIYGWIGGAAMIVFMYIAVFIIFNLNKSIVSGLHGLILNTDVYENLLESAAWNMSDDETISGNVLGDSLIRLGSVIITFVLLVQYLFRKFILGFLVIISPLAAVAYAREKNSQAFKTWLSELLSQTFIQSAHAIVIVLYLALVNASVNNEALFGHGEAEMVLGVGIRYLLNPIFAFLIGIAGVIGFGALTYNGLKLALSSGNPKSRSEAIKSIRNTIIGCFIAIGSVVIVSIIRGLMF